jgi:hypothetical protein
MVVDRVRYRIACGGLYPREFTYSCHWKIMNNE